MVTTTTGQIETETIRRRAREALQTDVLVREIRGARSWSTFVDFPLPNGNLMTVATCGSTPAVSRRRMLERLEAIRLVSRVEAERMVHELMEAALAGARAASLGYLLTQLSSEGHEFLVF